MGIETAATLASQGVSFKIDPTESEHLRTMLNLMLISGLIVAIGIALCVTGKWNHVPNSVQTSILDPLDKIATTIFTISLVSYALTKLKTKSTTDVSTQTDSSWKE